VQHYNTFELEKCPTCSSDQHQITHLPAVAMRGLQISGRDCAIFDVEYPHMQPTSTTVCG
jgi:hypothetical protein